MAGETPALLYRPALLCLRSFIKMRPAVGIMGKAFDKGAGGG